MSFVLRKKKKFFNFLINEKLINKFKLFKKKKRQKKKNFFFLKEQIRFFLFKKLVKKLTLTNSYFNFFFKANSLLFIRNWKIFILKNKRFLLKNFLFLYESKTKEFSNNGLVEFFDFGLRGKKRLSLRFKNFWKNFIKWRGVRYFLTYKWFSRKRSFLKKKTFFLKFFNLKKKIIFLKMRNTLKIRKSMISTLNERLPGDLELSYRMRFALLTSLNVSWQWSPIYFSKIPTFCYYILTNRR